MLSAMILRHINRSDLKDGDTPDGGCLLCMPKRARIISCGLDVAGAYEFEFEAEGGDDD